MLLLTAFFVFIFGLICGTVLLASRATSQQELIQARFSMLRSTGSPGVTDLAEDLLKQTPVVSSGVGLLLSRLDLARKLVVLSQQAAHPVTPASFLRKAALWGFGGAVLALLLLHSLLLALPAGLAACLAPLAIMKFQRGRRLDAFNKALPELIEMMSRSLRAGHALVAAIGIVAEQAPQPARMEFAEVFRQQNFGLPLRDALLQMLERVPSADLRVLVTAILVQKDTGGNLTQILDRSAGVIRERLKLQGDIRVHTAQGRFTGWILCLLPIVMLLLLDVINPGYSRALTDNALGRKLLSVGAALLGTGAYLIRRIVNGIQI